MYKYALLMVACLSAPSAVAQDLSFYLRGNLGLGYSRDVRGGLASNTGFGGDLGQSGLIEGAFGLKIPGIARLEASLAHRGGLRGDGSALVGGTRIASQAKIRSTALMAHAYYDFPVFWRLSPYVGLGGGFANNRMGDVRRQLSSGAFGTVALPSERGDARTDFAWALMAGTGITVTDWLTLDLGYRYFDGGRVRSSGQEVGGAALTGRLAARVRLHEILAGVRIGF